MCAHFYVLARNVTDSVSLWFVCHSYLAMLHTGLLSELNTCQIILDESRFLLFTLACNQLLAASFPVIKTFLFPFESNFRFSSRCKYFIFIPYLGIYS